MQINLDLNSATDYARFLRVKSMPRYRFQGRTAIFPDEYSHFLGIQPAHTNGFDYQPPDFLFDYQRDITRLALHKKKFAIFVKMGYGKSLIEFEFARHAQRKLGKKRNTLILTPLMVVPQMIEEYQRFYGEDLEFIPARNLQSWLKTGKGIGLSNWEALHDELRSDRLGSLIADECFPAGTLVDCVTPFGEIYQKPIETIVCGDRIWNASGVDRVLKLRKRKVPYAVKFNIGKEITSSPNHPVFTQRGWVAAQDLEPGDFVAKTDTAVRVVQNAIHAFTRGIGIKSLLQQILLCEMETAPANSQSQSSQSDCGSEAGQVSCLVVQPEQPQGSLSERTFKESSIFQHSGSSCKVEPDVAGHAPQTFRAWGKWDWFNQASEVNAGCSRTDLGSGVCFVVGPTDSELSKLLQTRFSESRAKSRYRSGWALTSLLQEENSRCEERQNVGFSRVESLEILELGHPELERCRDEEGALYFYDIEAERHPSFSVEGHLVHNSGLMKSSYGKWGQAVIRMGKGLEYKLAGSGTPAPNDRTEFANHALFLDRVPTVNAFYAKYFFNKGQSANRWLMKPHAVEAFYRDMADWSIFLQNPQTYGWQDNVGKIPPVYTEIHNVPLTEDQRRLVTKLCGGFFVSVGGIASRGKLARLAKGNYNGQRIATNKPAFIRKLVESWPEESTIIWTKYNDEQDVMEETFPNALSMRGSTPHAKRQEMLQEFKSGRNKVIISKGEVMGLGLNLQVCTRMIFNTCHDSAEDYLQCIGRGNRVGSTKPLHVHVPVTDLERPMMENVLAKITRIQKDEAEQERVFKQVGYDFFKVG